MYLVQDIDLETGETLDKPLVTPFSIKHNLKSPVISQNMDEKSMINSCLKYSEELKDGYYVVVAIDASGKTSGISNIVDVRDMATILPVRVHESVIDVTISSVMDIPTYVEVEMVDGSMGQMVIDYRGAQTYSYPDDELKMSIKAKVANTDLDNFMVVFHGMTYEDIMNNIAFDSLQKARETVVNRKNNKSVAVRIPIVIKDELYEWFSNFVYEDNLNIVGALMVFNVIYIELE